MFKQHVKVNFASNDPLPRVEATPITWYLAPGGRILPGEPSQKHVLYLRNAIGLS